MNVSTASEKTKKRAERMLTQYLPNALYKRTSPVCIESWKVGGEPVSFETAKNAQYKPIQVGAAWGAPWDTWWFHITGTVPDFWNEEETQPELVVDLGVNGSGPGFQAEALVYDADGTVIKAIEPYNGSVRLPHPGGSFEWYIEAAANPDIASRAKTAGTPLGDEGVQDGPELYELRRLEMGQLDLEVWNLIQELTVLSGLCDEIDKDRTRYAQILSAIDEALNLINIDDPGLTAHSARAILAKQLAKPAVEGHTVYAVGHAHIDSAWLWPLRETRRKVARTFSNVVNLTDQDRELVFAASSAQQYQWLKEDHPQLFKEVQRKAADGQFIPVGGMWVESDANLPGGESLARQFLQGTQFFRRHFDNMAPIAWLPDSFGYSASFPQIARLSGIQYFLTQKISWNDTNVFPHHSFLWQGLDGTQIFTHFPPSDTYNACVSPYEVALSEKQYSEKGKGTSSLMLFGWGDGGGGPTREMMAAARLQHNLEGSPKLTVTNPMEFFEQASKEMSCPPVWRGELYLELHRGTGTSHAQTKQGNRRCEALLHEAELWATYASVLTGKEYPLSTFDDIWHKVLLYQFHDILPGSAISWVYAEVERSQAEIMEKLETMIKESLQALVGTGTKSLIANAAPLHQRHTPAGAIVQSTETETWGSAKRKGDHVVLENDNVSYEIDTEGHIVSAYDKNNKRENIDPAMPGNVLQLFEDAPTNWDAWDIDSTYEGMEQPAAIVDGIDIGADQVTVSGTIGRSKYAQHVRLDNDTNMLHIHTHINWNESNHLLKQAFPTNIYATEATCEVQFGHLTRPVVKNTSWDEAKFESASQRWVHIADGDFGVSIANRSTYAYDFRQIKLSNDRPGTQIRASLLRSPHYPDPRQDLGEHDFDIAFGVGSTIPDAIRAGYRINLPARAMEGEHEIEPLLTVDNPNVILESLKMSQDGSNAVIARFYESSGGTSRTHLDINFSYNDIKEVGILEEVCEAVQPVIRTMEASHLELELHPFQIVTLRFER